MNNYVAFGIGAGVGLIAGGAASFLICNTIMRNKYEQQLLVDVESAKTEYRRLVKELKKKNEKDLETMEKDIKSRANLNKPALDIQRTQYMSIAKEYGELANNYVKGLKEGMAAELHVEVISPEDYGLMEEEGFESEELMYYADGILVNENDEIIENPDSLVGSNFKDHFGDYEDDSVYIRNFTDKIDFCILKSMKTYKEAMTEIFPAPTEESEE